MNSIMVKLLYFRIYMYRMYLREYTVNEFETNLLFLRQNSSYRIVSRRKTEKKLNEIVDLL